MSIARDSARKLPSPSKKHALTKSSIINLKNNNTEQARIFLNEALTLAKKTNYTELASFRRD